LKAWNYISNEELTFYRDDKRIKSIGKSKSGKYLYAAIPNDNSKIIIWNYSNLNKVKEGRGGANAEFSGNEDRIITDGSLNGINSYSLESGGRDEETSGRENYIYTTNLANIILKFNSIENNTIEYYDFKKNKVIDKINLRDNIYKIKKSNNGRYIGILLGSESQSRFLFFDVQNKKIVKEILIENKVLDFEFDDKDENILTCSRGGKVGWYNLIIGSKIWEEQGEIVAVECIKKIENKNRFIIGGNGKIIVYDFQYK
jgi:WD40 repeat protein